MKKPIVKNATSIRFRQWSRKSYAVFSGLHKIITIGQVSASISEKALLKNSQLSIVSPSLFENCQNSEVEEERETGLSLFELLLKTNASPVATDYPVCCSSQYFLTRGWNRANFSFPTILFLKR